ncbi:hypothetical protein EMPS_07513 [Entomortierella parvispora]|uniref:Uncharacterized protein n=1 Tax=Entomortierella parvispora TaxID=205924 RepID=A0A9P3HEM1_9FUNG|nr:hypothetical protein EMPS_07513 [Entomortierella parvispora]
MRLSSHWSCLDMATLMLSSRIQSHARLTATRLFPEIRATSATKALFSSKASTAATSGSDTGRPSSRPSSSEKNSDGAERKSARPARSSSHGPGSNKGKESNQNPPKHRHPTDPSPGNQGCGPGEEGQTKDTANKPNDRVRNTKGNKAPKPRPVQKNMPTNFRPLPATERIESLDKQAVQELFTKRAGAFSVANDVFSIKAAPMPFRKPPPPDIPLFVRKAMQEYDRAMAKYKEQLQEYERESASASPDQATPTPPELPRPMIQYKLANRRQYPQTIDSPHPPFRVSFMTSKKVVSKLATDRNMVRKKLVAAAEMVFRGDAAAVANTITSDSTTSPAASVPTLARPGYEYLIFPKKAAMWTTQEKLMVLMVRDLQNPKLYGERDTSKSKSKSTQTSPKNRPETSENVDADHADALAESKVEHDKRMISDPEIKFRWKYNRAPILEPFWKYALPNPLTRVQQSNAFLNRFCPEAQEALIPLRQEAGRLRKAAVLRESKLQRRRSKRFSKPSVSV